MAFYVSFPLGSYDRTRIAIDTSKNANAAPARPRLVLSGVGVSDARRMFSAITKHINETGTGGKSFGSTTEKEDDYDDEESTADKNRAERLAELRGEEAALTLSGHIRVG